MVLFDGEGKPRIRETNAVREGRPIPADPPKKKPGFWETLRICGEKKHAVDRSIAENVFGKRK